MPKWQKNESEYNAKIHGVLRNGVLRNIEWPNEQGTSPPSALDGVRLFQGSESAQPAHDLTARTADDLLDEDAFAADGGVDQTETRMKVVQSSADMEKKLADMMAGLCVTSVET